jgi:fatty acid desaturase
MRHRSLSPACYTRPFNDTGVPARDDSDNDEQHPLPSVISTSSSEASICETVHQCLESVRYVELKRLVCQAHLLQKEPRYYCAKMLLNLSLLFCGMVVVMLTRNSLLLVCDATFLAFVFTQMGFIVHDAGHFQIFRQRWKNDLIGILHANLFLGFSYTRWITTHNQHHAHPNQLGRDPDIDFPVLAFTKDQALKKTGVCHWIVNRQAYLFFLLLLFEAVNLKADCLRFLVRERVQYRTVERLCLAVHFSFYLGFLLHFLTVSQAALFIVVQQATFGLYLGLAIAPNHMGMPILEHHTGLGFLLQQALTTRNLRRHWLSDYCYGPLSCQIEHHLFPTIPLSGLRKAQAIIRPYFKAHGIPYHETGPLESYREIFRYLNAVSHSQMD